MPHRLPICRNYTESIHRWAHPRVRYMDSSLTNCCLSCPAVTALLHQDSVQFVWRRSCFYDVRCPFSPLPFSSYGFPSLFLLFVCFWAGSTPLGMIQAIRFPQQTALGPGHEVMCHAKVHHWGRKLGTGAHRHTHTHTHARGAIIIILLCNNIK